jgi:hypothetical protein
MLYNLIRDEKMNELSGIETKEDLDAFVKHNEEILDKRLKKQSNDRIPIFSTKLFEVKIPGYCSEVIATYKFDVGFPEWYGMQNGKTRQQRQTPFIVEGIFILSSNPNDVYVDDTKTALNKGRWAPNLPCSEIYSLRNGEIFAVHDAYKFNDLVEVIGKESEGNYTLSKYRHIFGPNCTTSNYRLSKFNKPLQLPFNFDKLAEAKFKQGKKITDIVKKYVGEKFYILPDVKIIDYY